MRGDIQILEKRSQAADRGYRVGEYKRTSVYVMQEKGI